MLTRLGLSIVHSATLVAMAFFLSACTGGEEPPPPPSSTSSMNSDAKAAKKKQKNEEEEDETKVEKNAEEKVEETDTTTAAAFLGADIGDDDTKKAATTCIKSGKYFDRQGAAPGKCTTHKLWSGKCTTEGLKETMNEGDKKRFDDMMLTEKYAGFLMDQCVDCAGSSDIFCSQKKTVGGVEQTVKINGIKILFVKEDAEAIRLQFMVKQ